MYQSLTPTLSAQSGIAVTLTPHAINSRHGGTLTEMATEVGPQEYDTFQSYRVKALKKLCTERHIACCSWEEEGRADHGP